MSEGAPSVDSHPYEPRDPDRPWGACWCGLSEAAHADTVAPYRPVGLAWRCPTCVTKNRPVCRHPH